MARDGRQTREIEPWDALLEAGRADERLVREATEHARPPRRSATSRALHPEARRGARGPRDRELYSHQAEAVHAAMAGRLRHHGHRVRASRCASTCRRSTYLSRDAHARALYLYPTKALAQDQARALHAFGLDKQVRPAIYDGDTPREERAAIRRRANVVLTNPDMLHVGILPNHRAWADFLHRPRRRRRRRGARLPRRVRLARRQRPAAAAAVAASARARFMWRARRSPTRSSSPSG